MSEQSAKSFINLLNRSGIVPEDELKTALSQISKDANGQKISVDHLTAELIKSGIITEWHTKKLLAGKYKGFFLGKYKLLGHLGTGGMSSVYLAEHKLMKHLRAIKVLPRQRVADKSYLERFYLEGRAAAALNHKNIVRIYDIGNEKDTHYMVMEYVDGFDLYELVKRKGPLDFDDVADYARQAAIGLQHAHAKGLVHRDIKPGNLLLTKDGVVKILDLGLALFREDSESLTMVHNEKVLGTADYLSPEQAINSHDVDHRADIYSLGCTVYYMLTGQPPFPEGTLAQRIAMHQTKEPESISKIRKDCPMRLVEIVQLMMRKKLEERVQDAGEVVRIMQEFVDRNPTNSNLGIEQNVTGVPQLPQQQNQVVGAAGHAPSLPSTNVAINSREKNNSVSSRMRRRSSSNQAMWIIIAVIAVMVIILGVVMFVAYRITQSGQQTPQQFSAEVISSSFAGNHPEKISICSTISSGNQGKDTRQKW